jgi:predicted CopG family antitoxin
LRVVCETALRKRFKQAVYERIHMGTKSARLDKDAYERIKAHKREGEPFSEAIDRLTSEYSLLDFAGGYSADDADRHRALLNQADERATVDRQDRLERLGLDTE